MLLGNIKLRAEAGDLQGFWDKLAWRPDIFLMVKIIYLSFWPTVMPSGVNEANHPDG